MSRSLKSALMVCALLGFVGGALAACGGEDHSGHDHAAGGEHEHEAEKAK